MKNNHKNNKNKFLLLILVVVTIALAGGGIYYVYEGSRPLSSKGQVEEIKPPAEEIEREPAPKPEPEEAPKQDMAYDTILAKYEEKYKQNNDLAGWISIPKTNIDYPVMQSEDNDFYLHRDYDKNYLFDGIPFLDFRNPFKGELYDNSIIYGHNMGSKGNMFSELMRYTNIDFYKKAPVIKFDTVYREHEWKVIAVAEANTDPRYGDVFQYYNFLKAKNQESLDWFLDEIYSRSYYRTDVDVELGDKLLTLQTCTNDKYETKLIVVARQVRPGEAPEVDVAKAVLNPARVLPR